MCCVCRSVRDHPSGPPPPLYPSYTLLMWPSETWSGSEGMRQPWQMTDLSISLSSVFCLFTGTCMWETHPLVACIFFSCMVICDMTGNMKRPMRQPIKRVQITSLPFISSNPSIYFLCETFPSTFVPAFSQLQNGPPFTQGAGDGAFSLAYRAHTRTPLHKRSPHATHRSFPFL